MVGRTLGDVVTRVVVNTGGTDWLTPLFTFVGVLAGGLLTWLTQRGLARRREDGEAKAAARVVQGDLAIAASRLKDMVRDDQRWFAFDDLRLVNWPDRQGVLALKLDVGPWEKVSQSALELAFVSERSLRAFQPGGPREGQHAYTLTDNSVAELDGAWTRATEAWNALASLAEAESIAGRLHEDDEPQDEPTAEE